MHGEEFPTYADLSVRPAPLTGTAWGVFGDDDELGTLNHLTADRARAAAASVVEGRTFNLNLPLTAFDPPLIRHRGALRHEVFGLNDFHRDDRVDSLFTQASTQIDSLRHFAHPDVGFYNGIRGDRIVAGTAELGIQRVAEKGIVGRGLLVDVARYREHIGRPLDHAASEPVAAAELDDVLRWQQTSVEPGDILLLRFDWHAHYRRASQAGADSTTSAGLLQSEETAAWLWDLRVGIAAADNIALEAWPPNRENIRTHAEDSGHLERSSHTGMLHRILIPLLGMTIGELWQLDDLSAWCAENCRFDMLVTAEPLNLPGGVGSPANALAIV